MKNIIYTLLLFQALLLLAGCASAKIQAIKAPDEKNAATITIFRPEAFAANMNDMIVSIGTNDIAVLRNNQYVSAKVTPGTHVVSVRGTVGLNSELTIKAEPSSNTYLEAAGSANNSVNFIPGSVLLKANFYIEKSESFDAKEFTEIPVNYK